jgi:hypothetical protein
MILPPPCWIILFPTAWQHRNTPFRLISRTWSQPSSLIFSASRIKGLTPALFTRISIFPNAFTASSTILLTSCEEETSAPMAVVLTPKPSISFATVSAFSRFLPLMMMSAPSLANPMAMSFPIPREEPVISATFPLNFIVSSMIS